jgi:hypothetical protein
LNHAAIDSGIPRESAAQRLGISVQKSHLHAAEAAVAAMREAGFTQVMLKANDLVGRKTARDGGAASRAVVAEIRGVAAKLRGSS